MTSNEPSWTNNSDTVGSSSSANDPTTVTSSTIKPSTDEPTLVATNGATSTSLTLPEQAQENQQQVQGQEEKVVSSQSAMNGETIKDSTTETVTLSTSVKREELANESSTPPSTDATTNSSKTNGNSVTPSKFQAAASPLPVIPDKPGKLETRVLSATETALASKPKSVTPLRKEQLLQLARASRLEWIRRVPFPYVVPKTDDVDPLAPLRETHAGRQLPAALHVLEHLYGLSSDPSPAKNPNISAEHIVDLFRQQQEQESVQNAVPTPEQARKMALDDDGDDGEEALSSQERALLQSYHLFLHNLTQPTAAIFLQHVKNFVQNLTHKHKATANQKEGLIAMLQSYVTSTVDAIRTHVLWKDEILQQENSGTNGSSPTPSSLIMIKRSFESFLYGQCREHVDAVFWTFDLEKREKEWEERIQSLQFVTAAHLEVACLQDESTDYVRDILAKPVHALQSVPCYHSPFEKLQRILALYHGINAALSQALNKSRNNDSKKEKKLPSADDILPAIILTVLQAKPDRLQYHLQLVEDLCPPEALRGEAGYAFTNLYSAIQFIADLNLDQAQPDNLTITADEFQKGLEKCRAAAKERLAQSEAKERNSTEETLEALANIAKSTSGSTITARDVLSARERGEAIDIAWAMRVQQKEEKRLDDLDLGDDDKAVGSKDGSFTVSKDHHNDHNSAGFPPGFKRSYNFLSLQPEDIKVADLPKLLEEYRMMVHTTEELLAERQSRLTSEKKEQMSKDQQDLYERVKDVDPSLLAESNGHRQST